MRVSVTDAKAQLTELVKRAEAGEEVVLTRHGQPIVQLSPVATESGRAAVTPEERRRVLDEIRASILKKPPPGVSAARSADFLYGDDGLPK